MNNFHIKPLIVSLSRMNPVVQILACLCAFKRECNADKSDTDDETF